MKGSPFSVDASLDASTRHTTTTVDANVFPPETNKVTRTGLTRKLIWLKCDGRGNMYGRRLEDPIDTLKRLDKLRKNGTITEVDYQRKKDELLALL